jgi:hypothetical protein
MKRKRKFGEQPEIYNGIEYRSTLEARTAKLLDMMRRSTKPSERVIAWERQKRYNLEAFSPVPPDHKEVIGTWTADFLVHFADGREEVWECKSPTVRDKEGRKRYLTRTESYRRAIKILKANQPNIVIREITKDSLPQ